MSEDLKLLLKRVKLQRYREGSPQKILAEIYHDLSYSRYGRQAWDLLVELIADKLRPMELEAHEISLLPETKHGDLADKYSDLLEAYIVAAKQNPWDYLGELLVENRLFGLGQNLTPRFICELMCKTVMGDEEIKELKTVLDPCVGTGRFLISATLLYPKAPLILFGIEIDLSLYRACVVNMSMFSRHPFSIICADSLMLDPIFSGPSSPIWWFFGNRWNPPDLSEFYVKPPAATANAFSLAGWIGEAVNRPKG